MLPVEMEIKNFHDAATGPSQGISKAHGLRRVGDETGHEKQIGLPDSDKGYQHNQHGTYRITTATKRTGQYMVHAVKEQEENILPNEDGTSVDNRLVTGKHSHGIIGVDCQHRRYTGVDE